MVQKFKVKVIVTQKAYGKWHTINRFVGDCSLVEVFLYSTYYQIGNVKHERLPDIENFRENWHLDSHFP